MSQKSIVIIGGGPAGLAAAEGARSADPLCRVALVCGEERLPYDHSGLYQLCLAGGDIPPLRQRSWYEEQRVDLVMDRAVGIGRENRQVKLASGASLPFDSLVLATGSRPLLPDAADAAGERILLSLEDPASAERIYQSHGPLVVLGLDPRGLELAWKLSRGGRQVTLVGNASRLLPRHLDKEGGLFLLRLAESAGLHMALNGQLEAIEEGRVVLADSRAFPASLVLATLTRRPTVNLAPFLGLAQGRPFSVDQNMATAFNGAFAAGECAEYQGLTAASAEECRAMGRVAGINAAGGQAKYAQPLTECCLDLGRTTVWSCGALSGESVSQGNLLSSSFRKLFFAQDRLVGAEVISSTVDRERLRRAIMVGFPRRRALSL